MNIEIGKYRVDTKAGTVAVWDSIAGYYTTTIPVTEWQRRWALGRAKAIAKRKA